MNMEIKPMGNTEQEKMSSLWGYFKNPVYRITTSITLAPCKAKQSFPAWKKFIPLLMSV